MPEMIRLPVVAGQFYPAGELALARQLEQCFMHSLGPGHMPEVLQKGPRTVLGLICPHAGYAFSGHTAAHAYAALAADGHPEVAVVVGLNHGRGGFESAVQTSGAWRTPLGDTVIATDVAEDIAEALPGFTTDPRAFRAEHSIEVQLPFLQYIYDEALLFVPVMMSAQDIDSARAVGSAIAGTLQGRNAVVIASTDMTHYEPAAVARRQDQLLIKRIEQLDPDGLIAERAARQISMCGAGPVAAALVAAEELGATSAKSLAYSTSGDVMPSPEVVGYYAAVLQ
ncbi:MAG TPA: AmmeMemoRadiSam system protein B [Armatimonadetes bacterium]|nr:AmmeMemoRadiSam system protein B [Armatimonadota bacterium]